MTSLPASPALADASSLLSAQQDKTTVLKAKTRAAAVDFEASFLNSMFSQMFTAIDGEGPFGGAGGAGAWRSFLSEEYAKSFAKAGGIGIADHVYSALLAQQEARAT